MRERERVAREGVAGADQGNLQVEAALGVAVEEESLFLAVRFVEDDEAAGGSRRLELGRARGDLHRLRQARPLAQVASGVEIRHPGRVRRVGGALLVAQIEKAVL